MVVALQLVVIVVSHSDIIFGGDLYAFGVVWSFAMRGWRCWCFVTHSRSSNGTFGFR